MATVSVKFTAASYGKRLTAFVEAGSTVDKAIGSTAKAVNAWAQMAAAGISTNSLTLEAVKESIIAKHPKATTLADCGNTVKGQWYAFHRIAKDNALDRLIAGEALNTVARDCKAVQEQKPGKRSSGKAGKAKKIASLNDTLAALHNYLDTALANSELAAELGNNKLLCDLLPKLAKVSVIGDAYIADGIQAKADKAAADKATKAAQAKARKAKAKAVTAVVAATAKAKAADDKRIAAAKAGRASGKGKVAVRLLKAA